MSALQPDRPLTRREFHFEFVLVWLFLVLVAVRAMPADPGWTAVLLPVGALGILLAHAVAVRRST